MPNHLTSVVKPLGTFLSFKDFNLLKSLAPLDRSFFNFMTACYFQVSGPSCYIIRIFDKNVKIQCSNYVSNKKDPGKSHTSGIV